MAKHASAMPDTVQEAAKPAPPPSQGSGGWVCVCGRVCGWGDSGVTVASPDEAGDTVSTTPPVMYRPWGSRPPQPLTYVGARVAKQNYNPLTHPTRLDRSFVPRIARAQVLVRSFASARPQHVPNKRRGARQSESFSSSAGLLVEESGGAAAGRRTVSVTHAQGTWFSMRRKAFAKRFET